MNLKPLNFIRSSQHKEHHVNVDKYRIKGAHSRAVFKADCADFDMSNFGLYTD